jgi:hypothetical protein
VRLWTVFSILRTRHRVCSCGQSKKPWDSYKILGITWPVERLSVIKYSLCLAKSNLMGTAISVYTSRLCSYCYTNCAGWHCYKFYGWHCCTNNVSYHCCLLYHYCMFIPSAALLISSTVMLHKERLPNLYVLNIKVLSRTSSGNCVWATHQTNKIRNQ